MESPVGSTVFCDLLTTPRPWFGLCGCMRYLPLQNVPNRCSVSKFLLLLRFLSLLKANMTITVSDRKRSKLCTVGAPTLLHLPRLIPPRAILLPHCSPPATWKAPNIRCVLFFHCIIQSRNAFLLLVSLLSFYHLSKPNLVQICHHNKGLP